MKLRARWLPLVGLAFIVNAEAACYSVYAGDHLLFQSVHSPVDLSKPLSETIPSQFGPEASMVTAPNEEGCMELRGVSQISDTSAASLGGAGLRRPSSSQGAGKPVADLDAFFTGQAPSMRTSLGETYSGGPDGTVYTGPRGGRYTITKSGNKSYLSSRGGRR